MGDAVSALLALAVFVLSLIAKDLYNEIPVVCDWFLAKAAAKIPDEERSRYISEWNGEYDVRLKRRSKIRTVIWAYRVYRSASATADVLRAVYMLEGQYDCDLDLFGRTVLVTDGCRIAGSLRCRAAEISGVVLGQIDAWRSVRINAKGVVYGNVYTKRFALREGGEFLGTVFDWSPPKTTEGHD